MKPFVTKRLLAAVVAACMCSAAAAADKAPAAPALGDVLKATGIDVSGYIDASYTHFSTDSTNFRTTTISSHAYDTEVHSFNLNAADVAVSYLPASGFGGMAELQFGTDVNFNAAKGSANTSENVLQAYVQYASGAFAVIGGKFTTLAGAEVQQAPSNTNFSRSFLYTFAIPGTHTGVRGTYTVNDDLKFMVGLNNGWDTLSESASKTNGAGKTVELGTSINLSKMLTLAASVYSGEEGQAATAGSSGTRTLVDVVATLNLSDAMSVIVNVDSAKQENAVMNGDNAKWSGVGAYFNYKLNDAWRFSVRGESFNDKDGARTTFAGGQKLKEATVTVGFAPAKNAELRLEARQDKSSEDSFVKDAKATDKQTFLGLEAVYKF